MADDPEYIVSSRSYKSRMWTYIFLGFALVVAVLAGNFFLSKPELAEKGVDVFLGLPSWAYPGLTAIIGAVVFWIGLKVEADWPEALGAFLVAGSVAAFEFLIGWKKFELGGLAVLPYILPAVVFLLLMVVGTARSR
ncbi:MAG: hypothetical protein IT186_17270 [Acidobacteria bacterium]|nr:hypothetical protein [Acidobacteriota bacterium]MCG3192237.1 hypothetical protein [Thermoanaerobaculia bacterium]MCK6681956.1 hypothetical protein [Thermoanaerobaculia bacterium]